MKKIEKKGKQKSDTGDGNAADGVTGGGGGGGKVKDENDKPLNYIKDEIQSECLFVGGG